MYTSLYIVHTSMDIKMTTPFIARFPLKGLEGGVIEHLAICCEGGKCCITGQVRDNRMHGLFSYRN